MSAATHGWPRDVARAHRRCGYWRGETFDDVLRERTRAHPDRLAIVGPQGRWCYRDLEREAGRIAGGLHVLGLGKGDTVVVHLANGNHFFSVCFALFRLGAIPVMALPAHRQAEIGAFCTAARARAYICGPRGDGLDHHALASAVVAVAPTLGHIVVDGPSETYPCLASAGSRHAGYRRGSASRRYCTLAVVRRQYWGAQTHRPYPRRLSLQHSAQRRSLPL